MGHRFRRCSGGVVCLGCCVADPPMDLAPKFRIRMPRSRSQSGTQGAAPRIERVTPEAALPGGEVEVEGAGLGPHDANPPIVFVDGSPAHLLMSRGDRLRLKVPELAGTGLIEVRAHDGAVASAPLRVARELNGGLHPVTSPAVSRSGMI